MIGEAEQKKKGKKLLRRRIKPRSVLLKQYSDTSYNNDSDYTPDPDSESESDSELGSISDTELRGLGPNSSVRKKRKLGSGDFIFSPNALLNLTNLISQLRKYIANHRRGKEPKIQGSEPTLNISTQDLQYEFRRELDSLYGILNNTFGSWSDGIGDESDITWASIRTPTNYKLNLTKTINHSAVGKVKVDAKVLEVVGGKNYSHSIEHLGMVPRIYKDVFSDHHGFLFSWGINTREGTKGKINIYYHSLDATHHYTGYSSRAHNKHEPIINPTAEGKHIPFKPDATGLQGSIISVRDWLDANGESLDVIIVGEATYDLINYKLLKEYGYREVFPTRFNEKSKTANKIACFYKSHLEGKYKITINGDQDIGNYVKVARKNWDGACIISSHIRNAIATKPKEHSKILKFIKEHNAVALFGDTNVKNNKVTSSGYDFTLETLSTPFAYNGNYTDIISSNSVNDKLFDKIFYRVEQTSSSYLSVNPKKRSLEDAIGKKGTSRRPRNTTKGSRGRGAKKKGTKKKGTKKKGTK